MIEPSCQWNISQLNYKSDVPTNTKHFLQLLYCKIFHFLQLLSILILHCSKSFHFTQLPRLTKAFSHFIVQNDFITSHTSFFSHSICSIIFHAHCFTHKVDLLLMCPDLSIKRACFLCCLFMISLLTHIPHQFVVLISGHHLYLLA